MISRSVPRQVALLALLSIVAAAPIASAHMGSTKFLRVSLGVESVDVVAELDPIDVAYELDLPDPESPDPSLILAQTDAVGGWLSRTLTVQGEGGACEPTAGAVSVTPREAGGAAMVRVELAYVCPAPRRDLVLVDSAVFAGDPQHEALVRITGHEDQPAIVLRRGRQEAQLGDAPVAAAGGATTGIGLAVVLGLAVAALAWWWRRRRGA